MVALALLGAVGLTLVVTMSTIAAPLRKAWPSFLECAQCVGVWVGAATGTAYCLVMPPPGPWHVLLWVLSSAFAVSAAAYVTAVWLHTHNPPKHGLHD